MTPEPPQSRPADAPARANFAGPAKWLAVGVVGGGSALGFVWAIGPRSTPATILTSHPSAPEPTPQPKPTAPAHQPAAPKGRINLNTATLADLDTLPGVGKATAQAILDYRASHGLIRTLSELDNIHGVGPALIERLRPLVTLDEPAGKP